MIRAAVAQIAAAALLVGIIVGWYFAADQDPARMLSQRVGVAMWLGHLFKPLLSALFKTAHA